MCIRTVVQNLLNDKAEESEGLLVTWQCCQAKSFLFVLKAG